MKDQDWIIIQTLYKHKNITKTARELFISQPSITKRLRQIEKEFGVTIVQRDRRGVHFTTQGEFLAKAADEILFKFRDIKEKVQNMGQQVTGTLRIGVSHYFTKYQLPGILKKFKMKYPQVDFQVTTGWSRDIYNLVYHREVHAGFIRGNYEWPDQRHLLFNEPICIASIDDIDLQNLPSLPRIDYQTEQSFEDILKNWWVSNYSEPPLIGIKVDKVDTCREMIINGLGYAIVPRRIFAEDEKVNKIDIKDREGHRILRETWMCYYDEILEINTVRAFIDFIKELDLARQTL
ncbi:LysR family transcriptional regulator [Bacillus sonorensis]|nr:LysR family transcriptional regulator [Bacillus sonorensis]MBG9914993.1 LysR family transcriptional regulator [Bacillus sonorensis]MCY7859350.1 LysR family transcriptional regulator [Bacillus sonorensis]MCY8026983.1 LysR family transcriptional regulator [Bacillus sonorensis]MCY8034363.1 LysR family transcriptional regulator [Bacillus sonorensis]MCY8272679.1 LysR family transcriptional regulator [Bacillus sonorensis]